MAQASRPLSPHLGIYRWYFTMALSIAHRVTGGALAVALILLAWWLLALAGGPESFATVRAAMDNFLGGIVLFLLTACLWYHSLNGIRHLVWDTGHNISRESAKQSGMIVVIATAVLTIVTWLAILLVA
ncbi:MAG: succinate dehydrogenase, cytochrome b556 subunit [Geminicoccaceae bacterium]